LIHFLTIKHVDFLKIWLKSKLNIKTCEAEKHPRCKAIFSSHVTRDAFMLRAGSPVTATSAAAHDFTRPRLPDPSETMPSWHMLAGSHLVKLASGGKN
jgi:hypothetical protein